MMIDRAVAVRADQAYHSSYFWRNALFKHGSRPSAPEKIVLSTAHGLPNRASVVDLGCGPGRNAIAIARIVAAKGGRVLCVDYLHAALRLLHSNAVRCGVASSIDAVKEDLAVFTLPAASFDLVLAWSAWEHTLSPGEIAQKVENAAEATREGGFNLFMFHTHVSLRDPITGKALENTLKRSNFDIEGLTTLLESRYPHWRKEFRVGRDVDEVADLFGQPVRWTSRPLTFLGQRI